MRLVRDGGTPPEYEDFSRWRFEPTGDLVADGKRGRALADEFLKWRQHPSFNPLLGHAVTAIAHLDRGLSALEIGFFSRLSRVLRDAEPLPPILTPINGGRP